MYYETIVLSNLMNVEFHEREVEGKMEKCISIPIISSGLIYGKNSSVILRLLCRNKKPNWDNVSHYISLYAPDKELRKRISERGYLDRYKFIGDMKPSFLTDYHRGKPSMSLDEAMETD